MKRLPDGIADAKTVYFEPFVGGGAVYSYLNSECRFSKCHICDINRDLYTAYYAVKHRPAELIGILEEFADEYLPLDAEKRKECYLRHREVSACVDAVLFAVDNSKDTFNFYNIGSEDWISVTELAEIVVSEMKLSDVKFRYTGGTRGWVGDVPKMQLSVDKLKALGWKPVTTSKESVRSAVKSLLDELNYFE